MRLIDYAYLLCLAALWGSVLWFRAQARVVGELWWSWVCIVAILTLKIGVIAKPFNRFTGGIYLDQLLIHLIGIAMITLTLSWLVRVRFGSRRAYRRARMGGAAAMVAFLVVTWLLAPVYDIPAASTWIPDYVQIAPAMAVHWLGFHSSLFAFTVVFVSLAWPVARSLPRGPVRLSIGLLITGAVLFGAKSGAEAVAQIGVLATGQAEPDWLVVAVNPVVLVVFALFLVAVALPLLDRTRQGRADGTAADGESLWSWIQKSAQGHPSGSRPESAETRFGR